MIGPTEELSNGTSQCGSGSANHECQNDQSLLPVNESGKNGHSGASCDGSVPLDCLLEADRVAELNDVLSVLCPRLVSYVAKATPGDNRYDPRSLGQYHEPQYLQGQFGCSEPMNDKADSLDTVISTIDKVLEYSVNTWNPGFLDKLYASNTPIGVAADLVLLILNTNSHVFTVLPVLLVLENYIGAEYARMFFGEAHSKCGGLTFPGGSYSNMTSMHMARALRYPSTTENGNGTHKFAIYTSAQSHYLVEKSAIMLGLGSSLVFKIAVDADGAMDSGALEQSIVSSKAFGFTPLYVNATAGSTVYGLYDPLMKIGDICRRHQCHFHIDGLWGGNVVFSPRHRQTRLDGCEFADSITVNPHKMLGVPTTCSFLLVPDVSKFQTAMALHAPYLFHGRENDGEMAENFDLADGTMGCGRRADSFKLYLAWKYYGTNGFQARIEHSFEIASYFVASLRRDSRFVVCQSLGTFNGADSDSSQNPNEPACFQVCFYYRPIGFTDACNTAITRFVSRQLHHDGRYLVDFSPPPGTSLDNAPGEFFRVVFNSPMVSGQVVDDLIARIIAAGENIRIEHRADR